MDLHFQKNDNIKLQIEDSRIQIKMLELRHNFHANKTKSAKPDFGRYLLAIPQLLFHIHCSIHKHQQLVHS